MSTEEKIKALSKGKATSWQRRLEQMPSTQVAAIYERTRAAGQLN